jgi:hypothetical protein
MDVIKRGFQGTAATSSFPLCRAPRAGLTLLKNFVFLKTAKIWRIGNVQENRERDPRGVKPVTSADSNRTRVSPRVAMRELHHRGKKIVAGMAANHAPPANKIGNNREGSTALFSWSSKSRSISTSCACDPSADAQDHKILCDNKAVEEKYIVRISGSSPCSSLSLRSLPV